MSIEDLVYTTYDNIDYRYKHRDEKTGVESGFYDLDDLTNGFQKSDLIILAARPAMGKTAFALNIAQNAALRYNKTVAIFSLEMSKDQLVQRLMCSEAEVDSQRLRSGNMQANDWEKLANTITTLIDEPIFIEDKPALMVEEMEEKIKELKPEVVFIDYLQLVETSGKRDRCGQIDHIMKELKRISDENEIIIFISSQLSRALEQRIDKRPMLSDLRDSGSVENISDIVIFIYRSEYYNNNSDDEYAVWRRGEAEIIVAKNRFGSVGTVLLKFAYHITKFVNPVKVEWF